ncbi:Sua5/YciO/YrdC/YwlC family protein, partial [Gordonia sp. ABSL11-1]|uniref:L-threonylcarbamoyladenylate synthase n=1 Tax=Gordonia sp. ABSL11-1 TaxID=3053924 RepID=UPI0025722E8B
MLADTVWPGPLNVVLGKSPLVPEWVTSGEPTVSLLHNRSRTLNILGILAGMPLAASSANRAGTMDGDLVTFDTAVQHIGAEIDMIVRSEGPSKYTSSSTIIDLTGGDISILRQGDVS